MNEALRDAILAEAKRIGADPLDFATVISYETGGTFDPWKGGPTTQWGRHVGLIQMGEPQRQKYGYTADKDISGLVKSAADYLVDNGYKPGMGLLDMYSTINAGAPGRYNASDANNGGAPGTVADKVNTQMGGHKNNAAALLGGTYTNVRYSDPSNIDLTLPDNNVAPPVNPNDPVSAAIPTNPVIPPSQDTYKYNYGQDAFNRNPTSPGAQYIIDKNTEALNENLQRNGINTDPGFLDVLNASTQNNFIMFQSDPTGVDRMVSADDSYALTPELLKAAGEDRGVSPDYLYMLEDATSIPNLFAISDQALRKQERDRVISEYGWTGTAMDFGAAMLDPVAIMASVGTEQLLAPLVALEKGSKAARVAKSAFLGGAGNAAAVGALAAASPEWTKEDVAKAFGIGMVLTGSISALTNKAVGVENARIAQIGRELVSGGPVVGETGTVGAMRNTEWNPALDNLTYLGGDTRHASLGGRVADTIQSNPITATPIDNAARTSPEALIGMRALVEDGSGARNGEVIGPAASATADRLHRTALHSWYSASIPAFNDWVKEQGVGLVRRKLGWDAKYKNQFYREVADYVENSDPMAQYHPKVAAAGEQFRKIMHNFALLADNPGMDEGLMRPSIPGFSGGPDKFYLSKYLNHEEVIRLQREFGNDALVKMLQQAIKLETPEMSETLVERMADGYLKRILKASFGIEDDLGVVLARGDHEEIVKYLREQLEVHDNAMIAEFMDLAGVRRVDGTEPTTPTSRGKRRTPIKYSHSIQAKVIAGPDKGKMKSVSVRDFFHNDADIILRRYSNEMAGHIAMAKVRVFNPENGELLFDGLSKNSEWAKFKNWIMTSGANRQVSDDLIKRLGKDLDNVRDLILGHPNGDTHSTWGKTTRRMGDYGFIMQMQNLGINQMQEAANMLSLLNLKALVRGVPTFGRMIDGTEAVRSDRVVREMMALTGIGDEASIGGHNVRYDWTKLGTGSQWYLSDVYDNAAQKAKSFVANMSLTRHINASLHQWTLRTIAQEFSDIAFKNRVKIEADNFKVSEMNNWFGWKDAQRIRELGLGDKELSMVLKQMLKHSEGTVEGARLRELNIDKWTPEARSAFAHAAHSWTGRVIQRNDIGALATWMTKPSIKMFLEFRSYMLAAWKKQTLYGLNHLDPKTFVNWTLQAMAGAATLYGTAKLTSLTMPDPDKYMKDRVGDIGKGDYSKLIYSGIGRSGFSSIMPMTYDSIAPIVGGEQKFSFRTSGQAQSVLGFPAATTAGNAYTALTNTRQALLNDRELSQQELKAWSRLLVGNYVGTQALLNLMIQDRPQRPPKNIQ